MNLTSEKLKRIREERGLTQAQFAERLGVTIRSLSRWETGHLSEQGRKYLLTWFKAHRWNVS